jgi:excisionase family DNA binding protein
MKQITPPDRSALFVRIAAREAERLDRASAALRTSKSRLVERLLAEHLEEPTGSVFEHGASMRLGHAVPAAEEPEVLTLEQLAELLAVDAETVEELAKTGEIPGRKIGSHWRFSRRAVLDWLATKG